MKNKSIPAAVHEFELLPKFSSRKSFYRRAIVSVGADTMQLKSYDTIVSVATRDASGAWCVRHLGKFSSTTSAHQKEFYLQFHGQK